MVDKTKAHKTARSRIFYCVVLNDGEGSSISDLILSRALDCRPEDLSCESDAMRALIDTSGAAASAFFKVSGGALFSLYLLPRKTRDQGQLRYTRADLNCGYAATDALCTDGEVV
jgi:hypothetical protein